MISAQTSARVPSHAFRFDLPKRQPVVSVEAAIGASHRHAALARGRTGFGQWLIATFSADMSGGVDVVLAAVSRNEILKALLPSGIAGLPSMGLELRVLLRASESSHTSLHYGVRNVRQTVTFPFSAYAQSACQSETYRMTDSAMCSWKSCWRWDKTTQRSFDSISGIRPSQITNFMEEASVKASRMFARRTYCTGSPMSPCTSSASERRVSCQLRLSKITFQLNLRMYLSLELR